jgi:hypothetical protein
LKKNPNGFAGQMQDLYNRLERFKGNANWRDWPTDPTRLSTALKRIRKPLEAVGITCELQVDRRGEEGGGNKDVLIYYTAPDHA